MIILSLHHTFADVPLWQGGKLSEAPITERTQSRPSLSLPPNHNEASTLPFRRRKARRYYL